MNTQEQLSELGIVYLPDHRMALSIEKEKKRPVDTVVIPTMGSTTVDYHFWGDGNEYPQTIIEACKINSIIPSAIAWKANQIASGGLRPGYMKVDEATGEETFIPYYKNEEIKSFMRMNNMFLYSIETLRDMYWWNMSAVDFGLDASRKKIVSVVVQDMSEVRFGRQNPKTGLKDKVYLNANWPINSAEYITPMPLIDPYYDVLGQVKNGSAFRYIYPLFLSVPKEKYEQNAPWHSVIESKWLDVAAKIPKLKAALMDNQMMLKYVIHVPISWWKWKFAEWDKLSQKERDEKQNTVLKTFNDLLTGVERAGKTLMLTFRDDQAKQEFSKWEIKALESRMESNVWIEDSEEATRHILFALGLDGTLIGTAPGKGMGAGSGSDKRSAFNIFIQTNKVYQETVCAPLNFISQYNEWKGPGGEDIIWKFRNEFISTQDTQSPQNRI